MASPSLTVLLDDGSGTFPFDVSRYVLSADGYEITRGRDDWQGSVTAGQLDLTLNNSDGRFTPGSTGLVSGYGGGFGADPFGLGGFGGVSSSPITVDQAIRLKETINGVTYTRFTGYVKSWPVAWPATVTTFATVRLTATDAQARAERRPLRSVIEEELLRDGPSVYYTLGEAEGSTTAGDTSGVGATSLPIVGTGTTLTFGTGTGPGVDGPPAPQFFSGKYLSKAGTVFLPAGQAFTLRASVTTSMVSAVVAVVDAPTGGGVNAPDSAWLFIDSFGKLVAFYNGFSTSSAGPVVNDSAVHDLAAEWVGGTLTAFVDGVAVASTAVAASTKDYTRFSIGAFPDSGSNASNLTGTASHVALYSTALSTARLLAHRAATAGFLGEAGTARLTRLAGYAGIPVGTLDSSLTNVSAALGWSGSFAGTEIQKTADAEMGLTYIDGTGSLVFHNRNRVVAKTAPDLILSSQYVTPDVNPVVDDQRIVNYMEVTAEGTGGTNLARNAASETTHGRYSGSQSYVVQTDAEAIDRGNWIVANLAEPGSAPRYGTLTINLYAMSDALASSVLAALDLDCWLRVTSMASQNPGGTVADVVVQGWTATRTGESWTIACNVVPHSLYAPVFMLDVSQLDVDTVLYV